MTVPFIIAEISGNHLGSLDRALALVDAAADAGCDAVKLQTWHTMSVDHAPLTAGPWAGRSLVDLYEECKTPWSWHDRIFSHARQSGLVPLSTPFDPESVDFLETLGCALYKVASFEITDLALIRYIASKGKPMIISTGMAEHHEIAAAVHAARGADITLLKCTSAYPAGVANANLLTMEQMREFRCQVGVSDHTLGHTVAVVATTLGATMIEKHLTLLRADGGPDAAFSAEPHEMAELVRQCRDAAAALGDVRYGATDAEQSSLHYRRSLWVMRDVLAGHTLEPDDIQSLRPATGAPLSAYDGLIGMRALVDIAANTPLRMDQFAR